MSLATPFMCGRCGVPKDAGLMKRDARNKSGYSSFCKSCHQAASVAWQKANPERLRATRRKRYARLADRIQAQRRARYILGMHRWENLLQRYGVTRAWYEEKLIEQGGACAICRRDSACFRRPLAVDHDHRCCPTGRMCERCRRGLLCAACNTALHSAEREPSWLRNAAAYLGHATT